MHGNQKAKSSTHTGFEPVTLEFASRNRPVVTAPRANHCTNGSSLYEFVVINMYEHPTVENNDSLLGTNAFIPLRCLRT